MKKQLVSIEWIDSQIQNEQYHISEVKGSYLITSVGWLIKEDEECIVIARDNMGDDEYRGILSIPKICIKKAYWLNLGKEFKP